MKIYYTANCTYSHDLSKDEVEIIEDYMKDKDYKAFSYSDAFQDALEEVIADHCICFDGTDDTFESFDGFDSIQN